MPLGTAMHEYEKARQAVVATPRQRQIALAQANARTWASASILGRVGNRIAWNWVVFQKRRTHRQVCFAVFVYRSNLHLRGYSESAANIPHKARVVYKLNVFLKSGQAQVDVKGPVAELPRLGKKA